jgi:hypothetical protein
MMQIKQQAELEIKKLLANWWTSVNQQLMAATGSQVQIGRPPVDLLYSSEIGQKLAHIALAAQHDLVWSEDEARSVVADCEAFERWLNTTPFTSKTPEEFWKTPVGYLVLNARLWAEQDTLISVTDAADISGLSVSTLSQRISRGTVQGFMNPYAENPRHQARLVRLTTAKLLREEQALKEKISHPLGHFSPPEPSRISSPRTNPA